MNTTAQRVEHADGKPTIVLVHGAFADAAVAVADHIVKAAQATAGSGR